MRSALLLLLLLPALVHAQAPPLTLTSPNPEIGGFFGTSVSDVPDVNGDGRADLLVGAYQEDGGADRAGRAYLYSGATGALLRTLRSPDPEPNRFFGRSVSGVPDANGDGRGDLLVGAGGSGGAPNAGQAYLFSGATGALLFILQSPSPEQDGLFGRSVSGVPDADGDGRGDLLVGAYAEDGGAFNAGRTYVFSGATGVLLHTLISPNPEPSGFFGRSVSGVPDADGDGHGDLLIGAYSEDGGGPSSAGRAYVFSGATGTRLHTLISPNPEVGGGFGISVSGVADTDGDGRGDLLIGAFGEDGGVEYGGRAYVFSGATGVLLRTLTSPSPEFSGDFGSSVSGTPDTDGDGRGDLLIGAPEESGGENGAGRAYLFSGATGALLRALQSPNPDTAGGFGQSVAGVADGDGDGRGDLLIGAEDEDTDANPNPDNNQGRAYFFSGTDEIITVTASGSPTLIVPGGTVFVTATVANTTDEPAPLDLWIVATRGGNPVLTRLLGSGTLPAGASVTRVFELRAPGNAPLGFYTVAVNVGAFPSTVRGSDAFEVTVGPGSGLSGAPAAEPFAVDVVSGDVFASDVPASAVRSSPSVLVSPNPFAGRTGLLFSLASASPVRLSVHDVLGREVALLVDRPVEAGRHSATFDGRGLAAGTYVYRLQVGSEVQTGRMTLTH